MRELSFIGGDRRQIRVINSMAKMDYHIRIYGFDKLEKNEFSDKVEICGSISEAVEKAETVILPLPYTQGREVINAPYCGEEIHTGDILRRMREKQLLLIGKADEGVRAIARLYGIHLVDYLEREELGILNAIPTAEGAIEIAMHETPRTIHGSRCLILGNGRIGKILGKMLMGLGAEVTVCVRKYSDAAYCKANREKSIFFYELENEIGNYDIVFNTVPTLVVGYTALLNVREDALIIDLASKPGGVDFETAVRLGKKTVWALSLPGKVAPETAGDFIMETILNILEELGVK